MAHLPNGGTSLARRRHKKWDCHRKMENRRARSQDKHLTLCRFLILRPTHPQSLCAFLPLARFSTTLTLLIYEKVCC
jgi:hypothetical protein